MNGTNKKWGVVIALVSLFSLAACTSSQVDNTSGSASSSTTTSGNGSSNSSDNNVGNPGSGTENNSNTDNSNDIIPGGNTNGDGSDEDATISGYVVQLTATSSSSKATGVKNTFVKEGYSNTTVNTVTINGKPIHRVQIGPFGTTADGDRVLQQMKRRYRKNQYVNSAVVKTVYGQ